MHITDANKNSHPIASKIPKYLWEEVFQNQLNEADVHLEGKAFSQVRRGDLPPNDLQALALLIITYPAIPLAQMISQMKLQIKPDAKPGFEIFYELALIAGFSDHDALRVSSRKPRDVFNRYPGFKKAAENGDLDTLKWYFENLPDGFLHMLSDARGSDAPIDQLCMKGQIDILEWIKQTIPESWEILIQSRDYSPLFSAAVANALGTLKWFYENDPALFRQFLSFGDYYYLAQLLGEEYLAQLPNDNANPLGPMDWLCRDPICFPYIEMHPQYNRIVHPLVTESLATLHQEHATYTDQNPGSVFDMDPERASFYFYVARNLIRRNQPDLNTELDFLLAIPAVRALAHQQRSDTGQPNELLRLAMSIGNQTASGMLLAIEAVSREAQRNGFYRGEQNNGVSAADLSQNRESSMVVFTQGEQKRFEKILEHYNPVVDGIGISHIMSDLREDLLKRYDINPATIMRNGAIFKLPAHYHEFQALNLSEQEHEEALKAYYRHTEHSAWRYISRPNPWMHPKASHVHINDARTERWSTFEAYEQYISLFYLAAKDSEKPPVDSQFTLESRIQLFITELALIGRAHNWDKSRIIDNKTEEYDDLEADKPSCRPGVKRRIFQSVLDHPLIDAVTKEILTVELTQFVIGQYELVLAEMKPEALRELQTVLDAYYIENNTSSLVSLGAFNIPESKIETFYSDLVKKYGKRFSENPVLVGFIDDRLQLNPKEVKSRYHVLNMDATFDFHSFLKTKIASQPKIQKDSKPDTPKSVPQEQQTPQLNHAIDQETLVLIHEKLHILKKKIDTLAPYPDAATAVKTICEGVNGFLKKYQDKEISVAELKSSTEDLIDKNIGILKEFRGMQSKKIGALIGNILVLILSLGTSYLATGTFTFFKPKTDTHEKTETLRDLINKVR